MTDKEKEFVLDRMKDANDMIGKWFDYQAIYKESRAGERALIHLKLTEILMNHFPMPQTNARVLADGPKKPDRPGEWLYQAPGAQGAELVKVDGEGDKLDYFNEKIKQWVSVEKAQGEWGGRVE